MTKDNSPANAQPEHPDDSSEQTPQVDPIVEMYDYMDEDRMDRINRGLDRQLQKANEESRENRRSAAVGHRRPNSSCSSTPSSRATRIAAGR